MQTTGKASKAPKQEAANGAKAKPNKKGKEGPSFGLGKGTGLIRSLIDSTASQWASSSSSNGVANGSFDSSSGGALSQVLQLAQQLQSSGEEEAGQGSVPETLGEPAVALDRRTATHLQQALKVRTCCKVCRNVCRAASARSCFSANRWLLGGHSHSLAAGAIRARAVKQALYSKVMLVHTLHRVDLVADGGAVLTALRQHHSRPQTGHSSNQS